MMQKFMKPIQQSFLEFYFNLQLFATSETTVSYTFKNEELKKELHQASLNGLKAFVESYSGNTELGIAYQATKSLCEFETKENLNTAELVSGVTTQISNFKKLSNSIDNSLGFASPKAGIIASAIGFGGAVLATMDGITEKEKEELGRVE